MGRRLKLFLVLLAKTPPCALSPHSPALPLSPQDGSLKLFLAVMLKAAPVVTEAVVTGVGGDRFFAAYLTEFGTE